MAERRVRPARPVLVAGLLIVLVALVVRTVVSGGGQRSATSTASAMPGGDARPLAQVEVGHAGLPEVVIQWPADRGRDPFKSELVHPPVVVPKEVEAPVAPAVNRAELVEAARSRLALSGTIVGEHGTAMLNGGMYRVGDVVAGFVIRRIESRGIVVEREGVHLFIPVAR